jgi:uncharacterized membrane protein
MIKSSDQGRRRLAVLFGVVVMVVYLAMIVLVATAFVAVPVYLAIEACRAAKAFLRRPQSLTRERARAQAELREQYASGVLTLVGLEERLEDTLRARSHLEVAHVLDDLPARPPEPARAARVEVFAALAIVLVFHTLAARVAGVLLGIGAVLPYTRWRVTGYAFLAGLSLLVAPVAAIVVGLCAAGRWREERL